MNRGKLEAKKAGKTITTGQAVKTIGKAAGILLAAGIALIAATDKTMSKAFPQQDDKDAPDEGEE